MAVSVMEFQRAVTRLQDALRQEKNEFIRDSVIQRFEFCVELAWKTAKKQMGSASGAPKTVIREMAQEGLIAEPKIWFSYLEARNLSSHTYQEELAEKVFDVAKESVPDLLALLDALSDG